MLVSSIPQRWRTVLKLPENKTAFNNLILQNVPAGAIDTALEPVSSLLPKVRDRRVAGRLWAQLVVHCPPLKTFSALPYLAVAVSRCVPLNPTLAFEATLHLLLNAVDDWVECTPAAPMKSLEQCNELLYQVCPELSEHLHQFPEVTDCCGQFWVPLQSMFLFNFPQHDWIQVFNAIVSRCDCSTVLNSTAVTMILFKKKELLRCGTSQEIYDVLSTLCPYRNIEGFLESVFKYAAQLRIDKKPLLDISASPAAYYPALNIRCIGELNRKLAQSSLSYSMVPSEVPSIVTHRNTKQTVHEIEEHVKLTNLREENRLTQLALGVAAIQFHNASKDGVVDPSLEVSPAEREGHATTIVDQQQQRIAEAGGSTCLNQSASNDGLSVLTRSPVPQPTRQFSSKLPGGGDDATAVPQEQTREDPPESRGTVVGQNNKENTSPDVGDIPLEVKEAAAWVLASKMVSRSASVASSQMPFGGDGVANMMMMAAGTRSVSSIPASSSVMEPTVGPTNSSLPTLASSSCPGGRSASDLPYIFEDEVTDV